jgi:hypothetical protein
MKYDTEEQCPRLHRKTFSFLLITDDSLAIHLNKLVQNMYLHTTLQIKLTLIAWYTNVITADSLVIQCNKLVKNTYLHTHCGLSLH